MWIWFGLAAAALIGEVASGTFYLLLVAVGLTAAGLAAWAGLALEWQLLACALVALLGLLVLRRRGILKKREIDAARNADVNLDIGQTVNVEYWSDAGGARVQYRGASWQARGGAGPPRRAGPPVMNGIPGGGVVVAANSDPAR